MFKEKRGITLIALVVTIIVLLLLAGITISSITGDNGILSKASKSAEETDIGDDKEKIGLLLADYSLEENPEQTLEEFLKSRTDIFDDVNIFNGVFTIKMNGCGHIYTIDSNGDIHEEENDGTEIADDITNEELRTMITTWSIEAGQSIELPVLKVGQMYNFSAGYVMDSTSYEYNIVVDWGDGSSPESYSSSDENAQVSFLENAVNNEPEIMPVFAGMVYEYAATHTYSDAGIYKIKITGTFDCWNDENWDNPTLISIDQWGVTNTKEYSVCKVTESIASPSKNSFQNCSFSLGTKEALNIPRNAFYGVANLYIGYDVNVQDIMIPTSAQNVSIESEKIYNIYVENDNSKYTSVDGILYTKDKKTLVKYPVARTGEFVIPDFVEILGTNSFYNTNIDMVKISSSVKTVKEEAFYYSNIKTLYIPVTVEVMEENSVCSCDYLSNIYCEIAEQPAEWGQYWVNSYNPEVLNVIWGYIEN